MVRQVVFAGLAVVSSSVALVGLSWWFAAYEEQMERLSQPEDSVYVVVAARDLYQGVEVTERDLYAVQFPASKVPEGVFLTPQHVLGRVPRDRILANEMVRAERLSQPERGLGLNAVIPRGQRALSIDLGDGEALQGVLAPGSFVDVLVTVPRDGAEPETHTLLQAIYVLAVDARRAGETAEQAAERRGRQRPSVTLLVNVEEAEQVAHAKHIGEVRLALRSGVDLGVVPDLQGVTCGLRPCPTERIEWAAPAESPDPECTEVKLIEGEEARYVQARPDGTLCE
jgi:pilus assembly protein CpaB